METTSSSPFGPDDCNPELSDYSLMGCVLFEGYSDDARHFLWSFLTLLETISLFLNPATIPLCVLGIVFSLFHFAVLAQKSMRTSSANIILLGIVLCDIFSLLNIIKAFGFPFYSKGTKCTPPPTVSALRVSFTIDACLAGFRRSTTFLGVLLASIRYLAVRFFMISERFTRPRTGVLAIIASLLLSAVFAVISWQQVEVKILTTHDKNGTLVNRTWTSDETCDVHHDEALMVTVDSDDAFFGSGDTLLTTFTFWNGLISKIIPAFLFPILSVLLLVELAKTKSSRNHATTGEGPRKDRTTVLILLMTVSFMIVEIPLGIVIGVESLLADDDPGGVLMILTQLSLVWNLVYILNSTFHFLLCFGLSVQYRETASEVIRAPFRKRGNRIEDGSFSGDRSQSNPSSTLHRFRGRHSTS